MGKRDPRVDEYIKESAPYARPILRHLRAVVHAACPDVMETLKWGAPSFTYHGILCSFAAFKEHAAFGFWKGTLIVGDRKATQEAMGSFGRLTRVADLPSRKLLTGYIRRAMELNEQGIKAPVKYGKPSKGPLVAPEDLSTALRKNRKAAETFAAFSPSAKREYIEWITEAKRAGTRSTRVATAIEWMAEGKQRNWKYMRK